MSGIRREVRGLLKLAGPVIGVQLGMMAMGTVDVMMLGRVDEVALAAGALGNSIGFGILMFPFGVLMALDPLVSQAFGARDNERIRLHFQRGLLLAVVLFVPAALLMWNTEGALRLLSQKEEVLGPASAYIRALVPGGLAFLLYVVLRQTLQAMTVVKPALLVIVLANGVNIVANYAVIFGHFGFPRLEVVGSAMATSVSRWFMFLGLLVISLPVLRPYLRRVPWAQFRPSRYRRFVALGTPVGLQISLELWVFAAVAVLMGSLGTRELAGHNIALNLAALTFMVPLGLGGASATRVGNAIGRDDQPGARRAANVGLCLGAGVMAVFALVFLFFPYTLSRLYTDSPGAIEMAVVLLPIAAVFQVADGTQVVAAGILRGTADTRWPAVIAFIGYWALGLPFGVWLAFRIEHGPAGLWWGLTLGLSTVAVLFLLRIRRRFSAPIARLQAD